MGDLMVMDSRIGWICDGGEDFVLWMLYWDLVVVECF